MNWVNLHLCSNVLYFAISEDGQQNLDAIAREKIVKFVLTLMGEYFKIVEDRLELEVKYIKQNSKHLQPYILFSRLTDIGLSYSLYI